MNRKFKSSDIHEIGLFCEEKEVTAPEYERAKVDASFWGICPCEDDCDELFNVKPILFPKADYDWGLITKLVLFDKEGNILDQLPFE